jgi:trans-aconitate 2-methyltransferase
MATTKASFSTSATRSAASNTPDWSATQYLKFGNERTRPVHDLVAQILPSIKTPTPRIYDLGCGPGNSTTVLADAFPGAKIMGVDSSPDMIRKASATFEARGGEQVVKFEKGNLEKYAPEGEVDLLFSNAVFHWLRSPKRIPTLIRLMETLKPGGVLAFQVPDNYNEPTHVAMREVASQTDRPWSSSFASSSIGDLTNASRPDLDPIESPSTFYKSFMQSGMCETVNLWRTQYQHVLQGHGAIVEWVKGTGLQPYLNMMKGEEEKKAFLEEYERALSEKYESIEVEDGKKVVLLQYPRLFVVAVRK